MTNVRAFTATIVFQSSAVNRDESIGGNIQSIKKLRRKGKVYSFLSRAFLRHKLFNALVEKHNWKQTPVTSRGGVIQFDVEKSSIIDSEEMDFFGYMSTISDTVVRKAPVGMTKAISLEPWEGDMAFYANHDLVRRLKEQGEDATPNPFSKEEHLSLYRYSVVLDLFRIGRDEVMVKGKTKIFGEKIDSKKEVERENGKISVEKKENFFKVSVELKDSEKKRRIREFLDVLINGYSLHSSTESWSTAPLFIVAATLKVPMILFDPYLDEISGEKLSMAAGNSHAVEVWIFPGMFDVKPDGFEIVSSPKELLEKVIEKLNIGD